MDVCLVCGYSGLEYPLFYSDGAPSFTICDCCGFESGYDDLDQGNSIEDFRKAWIENGCQWHIVSKRPADWKLEEQLKNVV